MSIFAQLAEHAQLGFQQGRMLPLDAYASDAVLAAELEHLFARDWLCVARTADLAEPGDYLTADLPAEGGARSIIVTRDRDDRLRAFDNICIHRGARLLDGCGNRARITCPYHAWIYRLDGSLVGGPYLGDSVEPDGRPFDPSRHRLVELAVEVWEGFIFVNQQPTTAPLAPRLAGLADVVGRYRMADYVPVHRQSDVWATNWKLLVENFMDAYHVFKVHASSFGSQGDNTLDTTMYPGTSSWAHHRVHHDRGPDLAAPGSPLEAPWRKTLVLAAVFPGLMMQLQPDWLWWLQVMPEGTGHVRIAWQVAVAPTTLATQADQAGYVADLLDLVNRVNGEDQPIVEGVRAGVCRPQIPRGPLSYLERNVHDFDRYVSSRLASATATDATTR